MNEREMNSALARCLKIMTYWCPHQPDLVADALPWCWRQLQASQWGVTYQLIRRALWRARRDQPVPPAGAKRRGVDVYDQARRRSYQSTMVARRGDPVRQAEIREEVRLVKLHARSLGQQLAVQADLTGEQDNALAARIGVSTGTIRTARMKLRRKLRKRYPDLCH